MLQLGAWDTGVWLYPVVQTFVPLKLHAWHSPKIVMHMPAGENVILVLVLRQIHMQPSHIQVAKRKMPPDFAKQLRSWRIAQAIA